MRAVTEMTRKEFNAIEIVDWQEDIGEFDSLVILPLRRMHESGYRCMDFIACKKGEPICRISGSSDVIHIGGIGGFGSRHWTKKYSGCPIKVPPVSWSIDCLPKSGLLQLFSRKMLCGPALSSFEVYSEE